jgi:hypothetical protein
VKITDVIFRVNRESLGSNVNKYAGFRKYTVFVYGSVLWIQKQDIEQFRCRTLYFNCYLDRILLLSNWIAPKASGWIALSKLRTTRFSLRIKFMRWISTYPLDSDLSILRTRLAHKSISNSERRSREINLFRLQEFGSDYKFWRENYCS